MKVSSVSPDLWLAITPQPAALAIFTASMDSLMVPIWFTCRAKGERKEEGLTHSSKGQEEKRLRSSGWARK
jgi:hypothetical protein